MKITSKSKILAVSVLALGASAFAQTQPQSSVQASPTLNPYAIEQGLSAEQYHDRAVQLANQADALYNPDFYTYSLWTAAANYGEMAVKAAPDNLAYQRTLGMIYTKSQFWWRAYNIWNTLSQRTQLDAEAQQWAALSAAKIGYIRLSRGLAEEAVPFLEASLRWQSNAQVQSLLDTAQGGVSPDGGN